MKENKYYTHVNFFLPFAYVMILGFFFSENTEKVNVAGNNFPACLLFYMHIFIPLL